MISPRALLDIFYCQTALDLTAEELAELLDEGLLYPAFNIACPDTKRREVRILSAGLVYYASTERPLPADPSEVISDIFPPDAAVTTATLPRLLNCSRELVVDLCKSKALTLAPGEMIKRGRFGSSKVVRTSAISFLASRIL